jgi:shikimate dehydrogenase
MKSYGLIGYPLGHSFSRKFFTDKFSAENKQEQYLNFELPSIDQLLPVIGKHPDLAGLNVTIPYKEQVLGFMNRLDPVSETIKAVNTIKIRRDNEGIILEGYNTDVYGFTESLRPLLKPHHRKALILGTGGASKAVKFSLENLNIGWMQVSRAIKGEKCITYDSVDQEIIKEYMVIVNTTPAGTYPDTEAYPPVPYQYLSSQHLLYDLVYNPAETRFLAFGREMGASVKNGYEMLELQAIRSYEIWNERYSSELNGSPADY